MDSAAAASRLDQLATEVWREYLADHPVHATALGVRDHDDRMPDPRPEARAARHDRLETRRREVEAIPEGALDEARGVTRAELLAALGGDLARLRAASDEYLVSHMAGLQVMLPRLASLQPLRSKREAEAFRGRVEAAPTWVQAVTENLRAGLKRDRVSAVTPVARSARQLSGLLTRPTAEWTLVKHAAGHSTEEGARVQAAVDDRLRPALANHLAFLLGELLPRARSDEAPGACHLPRGDETYLASAKAYTSLDIDPQQVHDRGLEEVARLHRVVLGLGDRCLGARDLRQLRACLDSAPDLHFRDEDDVLARAREAVDRAWETLDRICTLRPAGPCQVEPIPALEAPDAPLAYYRAPSVDGARPGTYYVNTHAPTTKLAIDAEGVAFHEAVPGHHLQIAVAQTLDLPDFRRFRTWSAYAEGWALYSEKLSDELGLYSRDLDKLGMLSQDLWRACRLVLDTGLHALGWSRQQAIDFAMRESLLPRETIENEVDRFVVMPGQALTYKLGEHEVQRLRRRSEERDGDTFSLTGFHDRVLGAGAVSLPTLAKLVEG